MEEWRSIPGYEGLYEISNMGRIRSLERTIVDTNGRKRRIKQAIMIHRYTKRMDRRDEIINLSKDGIKKTHRVSRLVAMTWCKDYQDGLTVNHIDGNTLNNNASNLECISLEENVRKGHKDGLYHKR